MEFYYFSLGELMQGYESFDWAPVEGKLGVSNPLKGGKPLRFANMERDGEWFVLP